jgi:hypothetical protein
MGFILGITVAGAIFEEFPNRGRDHPANREADHKNENKSLWVPSEPIDLYTLVLTVFTGVLAFSTIGLWQQTKRLAQGAEDQLVETAKAADAAKASAEIMMHGERAWMHPRETQMAKPDRLFPAPSKGPMPRRPQAVLKAYNVGKTPARIIRYACRFHTVLKDAAPNSPNYGQPIEVSGREIIVFEGLFKHIAPLEEGALGQSDMEKIQSGQLWLLFYGFIEYEDTFERLHRTGFARIWDEPPSDREKWRRFRRWGGTAYNYHT